MYELQQSTISSLNSTFTNRTSSKTDNLKQWLAIFEGKPGSLYDGGTFFTLLTFNNDYPLTSPIVLEFKTRIYHCNIYHTTGLVKHDIFDKNWSPTITIRQIIPIIANLLVQCEPDCCAMKELGLQYKYERIARLWTKNFAC